MKARLTAIAFGLMVCVVLALTWARLRAEARALTGEWETFAQSDRVLAQRHAFLARRVVEVQGDLAERKRVVLATQSAADRARANVGPLVARLKAEQAGRAPVVRPPAPPTMTGGGAFFPELMSDPEYNALYARSVRSRLEVIQGRALRELGVPEAQVAKVIDLLADQEAAMMDLQNLTGGSAGGRELSKLWGQLRAETQGQLRAVLGADAFARYVDATEGAGLIRRASTETLVRRLSYSEEPLSAEQLARLQEYEVSRGDPRKASLAEIAQAREARKTGVVPVDDARVAFYRSVLTSAQMEAVDELHREAEAGLKRSLLPRKDAAGAK